MTSMPPETVYRSEARYLHLAAVVVVVAVVAVLVGSPAGAGIAVAVGLIWLAFAWRAGIAVMGDGIEVRRFPRAMRLSWSDVYEFRVFTESAASQPLIRPGRSFGSDPMAFDASAAEASAVKSRTELRGAVTVVTQRGERIKVRGTAATTFDRDFPARTAAALNAELARHSPRATETAGVQSDGAVRQRSG